MRTAKALTLKRIERLTSARQGQLGHHRDAETKGLYLQVVRLAAIDKPASASWIMRYQLHGKEHQLGLGSLHDVGLEEARRRVRSHREKLSLGVDPLHEKREAERKAKLERAKRVSFEAATLQFHEERKGKEAEATSRQFISTMKRYAFPILGATPVGEIDRPMILQVLRPIWNTKRETATRVRSSIERVLDSAEAHGQREGMNPARWQGSLEKPLNSHAVTIVETHHAALPYAELPRVMRALRKRTGSAARALELLILTATRTSEVIEAVWSEFDLRAKLWTIPAERMKATRLRKNAEPRPHVVPLSDAAIALLEALPREDQMVFPGQRKGRGLSNMAMSTLLQKRMKVDATVHGFRSTFKDWVAERTGYENIVSEMALAHTIDDKTEAAYRRGDLLGKRTRLMQDWASYCDGKMIGQSDATIVPLRR